MNPFNWKRVLSNEYRGLCALIFAMVGVEIICRFVETGKILALTRTWNMLLAANIIFFISMRILVKKTKLLKQQRKGESNE